MKFKAYSIILTRQIRQKLGRFLLASGGIAVGVWAITLTNGLSAGAQQLIQDFVNGQPAAKEFQINKTKEQNINFFTAESPAFLPITQAEVNQIVTDYPQIDYLNPRGELSINISSGDTPDALNRCKITTSTDEVTRLKINAGQATSSAPSKDCKTLSVSRSSLRQLYENNRSSWSGAKIAEFGEKDIAVCYKCGDNFFEAFKDVTKPSDLIGKTIVVSATQSQVMYPVGETVKFSQNTLRDIKTSKTNIFTENVTTYTIRAVIDDSESGAFSLSGFGSAVAYFPGAIFDQSFKLANPGVDQSTYGYISVDGAVKSYSDLDATVQKLNKTYTSFSLGLVLVQAIPSVFGAVNLIFLIFGLVAVVASIFGIVNVMTISVLERKKEIGILKALGAKDSGIFTLFVSEAGFLGVLGWAIGTGIATLMGYGLSAGFKALLSANTDLRKNLETFNIDSFNPIFAPSLLVTTLAIAVVCTVLAGLIPSIRAARQNPAEVMRAE